MRILVVAPFFAPYNNPRARRWTAICNEWAAFGIEVHVLTSLGAQKDNNYTPNRGVVLHRVGYNAPKELLQYQVGLGKRGKTGTGKPGMSGKALQWLSDHLLEIFWWPDSAFLWIRPAKKYLEQLLKVLQFDGIISVGLPFSAHCVVLPFAQKQKFSWVADMGDPFALQIDWKINNHRRYDDKNKQTELAVLQHCTAFCLTNISAQQLYSEYYGQAATVCKVIGPIAHASVHYRTNNSANHPIRLGYFGTFYKGVRGPSHLLALMLRLQKHQQMRFKLAGEIYSDYLGDFEMYQQKMGNALHWLGHLNNESALQQMQNCDILLSLGNITTYQLPSKCADYYASGKPILHIQQADEDPCLDYFFGHPMFLSVHINDIQSAENEILMFINEHAGKHLSVEQINMFMENNSAKAIAIEYLRLLKKK